MWITLNLFWLRFLYPYLLVGGVKMPYPLISWNIHPIDLKLSAKVYTNKNFLKMPKRVCLLSGFCWHQHFFYGIDHYSGNLRFLRVYSDKSNVIQVLESNYIDSNCYIHKKDWFFRNHFCFFSNTVWKRWVWQTTPTYDILKYFWPMCAY